MTPEERGKRILQARKAMGMTQLELSQRVGLSSQSPMSHYERGTRRVPIDLLPCIAKATNVPVQHFIGDMEEPLFEPDSELGQMLRALPPHELPDLIAYGEYRIWANEQRGKWKRWSA